MLLSFVIPAYNEEKRIGPTLESIGSYLENKGGEYEIIVVDDGSTDRTVELVNSFIKSSVKIKLLKNGKNETLIGLKVWRACLLLLPTKYFWSNGNRRLCNLQRTVNR